MRLDIKIHQKGFVIWFLIAMVSSFPVNAQYVILESGASVTSGPSSMVVLANGTSLVNNSNSSRIDGTFVFDGPYQFEISGERLTEFSQLVIENDAFVSLLTDIFVDSVIHLNKGIINLADKNLNILTDGKIDGPFSENTMIAASGKGKLVYHPGKNGTYLFPIGDISDFNDYSPAILTFTKGNYDNASISVNVKNQQHASISEQTNYLKRYWTVEQSGISEFRCSVNFRYVTDDIIGEDEYIYGGKFTGSRWKALNKISSNEITGDVADLSVFSGARFSELGIGNSMEDFVDITFINNILIVNSFGDYKLYKLELINLLGQTILQKDLVNSGNHRFALSDEKGIFLVRISGELGVMTKKMHFQ